MKNVLPQVKPCSTAQTLCPHSGREHPGPARLLGGCSAARGPHDDAGPPPLPRPAAGQRTHTDAWLGAPYQKKTRTDRTASTTDPRGPTELEGPCPLLSGRPPQPRADRWPTLPRDRRAERLS